MATKELAANPVATRTEAYNLYDQERKAAEDEERRSREGRMRERVCDDSKDSCLARCGKGKETSVRRKERRKEWKSIHQQVALLCLCPHAHPSSSGQA
jgi:hypothetical protein